MSSSLATRLAESIASGPHRMTVGLRPLTVGDWIEKGADFDDQLRQRAALLRERADVIGALAGSQHAQRELLEMLIEHLREHFADCYNFASPGQVCIKATGQILRLTNSDHSVDGALRIAGHLVPEDLCLLQRNRDGQYTLSAAALCFPTRWRLADKLGHPLLDIHKPVPGYADSIGAATDRVMAALQPERPLWRHNWSLLDCAELYQPQRSATRQPFEADQSQDAEARHLWFRHERQTLRRLPKTGAVLFTIRIRQCTLAALCQVPGAAKRLLEQVQSMPAALKVYKGLDGLDVALCDYLRAASRVSIRS